MTESKTMTKEELANLHDDHCWRMSPYKEIDNRDSFIAGYEAAESKIKELEKKLEIALECIEIAIEIENCGLVDFQKYGLTTDDCILKRYEDALIKIRGVK